MNGFSSIFSGLKDNFESAHDPAQAAPAQAPVVFQLQPPQAPAAAPVNAEMAEMKAQIAQLTAGMSMLLKTVAAAPATQPPAPQPQAPVVEQPTTKKSALEASMAQLVQQQADFTRQQKEYQERLLADAAQKELQARLLDAENQLHQQTGGSYDPLLLDRTSVEAFVASAPRAIAGYTTSRQHFFSEFMATQQGNAQQRSIQQLANPNAALNPLLQNMPLQGNGVQPMQQAPASANQMPQFVHPQIDGGASYAASRQRLLGQNLVAATPATQYTNNLIANQGVYPQQMMQSVPMNPQQMQWQQQQAAMQQQQRPMMTAQQQQAQQYAQWQAQQAAAVAPLPDPAMSKGGSLQQLAPAQSMAAQQAAQQAVLSARAGRSNGADTKGQNLRLGANNPTFNLGDMQNRYMNDDRSPMGLVNPNSN